MSDYPKAVISTESGDISVELWNDVAPKHVENFLELGRSGFYDGLIFHRVVPDFVIQGGCPKGDGTGGPGWNVSAEFNKRQHVLGTLSMARSNDPDSAGSQFFICLGREHCRHLDGKYTGFGQVTDGLDVVQKIGSAALDASGRPRKPVKMISVRVIDE